MDFIKKFNLYQGKEEIPCIIGENKNVLNKSHN